MDIRLPDGYGYVILGCGVAPLLANMYMGGPVMKARKEMDVPYPNLYAVPGVHKHADAFNRVQRGHQNYLELLSHFVALSLVGGLKHPLICSVSGVLFSVGSVLFQIGYADLTLKVETARYQRGGVIKWIGFLGVLGSSISLAGTIQKWW